jgi:hypothetical protein
VFRKKGAPGAENSREVRDPDFLYATLDRTACAAFIDESRMSFPNANQLDRKSGGNCDFLVAGASENSCPHIHRTYSPLFSWPAFISQTAFSFLPCANTQATMDSAMTGIWCI